MVRYEQGWHLDKICGKVMNLTLGPGLFLNEKKKDRNPYSTPYLFTYIDNKN